MPLPGLKPNSQSDIMKQELSEKPRQVTDTLRLPGIDKLHLKSKDEIAEVLANVLKSRANITALKFVVGSHLELTCDVDPTGLKG